MKVLNINVHRVAGIHWMIELLEEWFTAKVVPIQESRCGPNDEAWVASAWEGSAGTCTTCQGILEGTDGEEMRSEEESCCG